MSDTDVRQKLIRDGLLIAKPDDKWECELSLNEVGLACYQLLAWCLFVLPAWCWHWRKKVIELLAKASHVPSHIVWRHRMKKAPNRTIGAIHAKNYCHPGSLTINGKGHFTGNLVIGGSLRVSQSLIVAGDCIVAGAITAGQFIRVGGCLRAHEGIIAEEVYAGAILFASGKIRTMRLIVSDLDLSLWASLKRSLHAYWSEWVTDCSYRLCSKCSEEVHKDFLMDGLCTTCHYSASSGK